MTSRRAKEVLDLQKSNGPIDDVEAVLLHAIALLEEDHPGFGAKL